MRLAFMGTPQFSVTFLQALHQAGHEIAAVYTQPPRQSGRRGLSKTASPVSQAAQKLNIPVYTPKTLRDSGEQAQFSALKLDAAVIVAYGLLLPEPILNAPRLGCYNAHASLLPRWRGAAPVQRAIEAGDSETGIVIMKMDKGLDTGDILCAKTKRQSESEPFLHKMPLEQDITAGEVFSALAAAGAELMANAVAALEQGRFSLRPQPQTGAVYARKIEKSEAQINWQQSAAVVHKHICAFSPNPGAWCEMQIGGKRERVKILASHCPNAAELQALDKQGTVLFNPLQPNHHSANHFATNAAAAVLAVQCATGMVFLTKLQKSGGKPLAIRDFLRGATVQAVY